MANGRQLRLSGGEGMSEEKTLPGQQMEPKRKRTRREAQPPTSWAEDVKKEPVTWAVPGYFPRRIVSLIAGPRDAGKTLYAVWLAAEASQGIAGGVPLRVWLNSQEDDLATVLRPRIDAATDHLDQWYDQAHRRALAAA